MAGWRVWLAFEARPGVSRYSGHDMTDHWRGLYDACRRPDGKVDAIEFDRWMTLMIEHGHARGAA